MQKISFKTTPKCQIPYSDEIREYFDAGVLFLPDSYTENGKPTRLIINCHGAGGTVTTDDSQISKQTLSKYLLANGYAVVDVNGLPEEYAAEFGIDIRHNVGSPIAVDSYIQAYRFCTDNYNLYKEVFVHGGSMGGISSTNLVLSGKIPVIAQTGFCPVLDAYNEMFLHPWSKGKPKIALTKLYSFEIDEGGEPIYDERKLIDYNPMATDTPHPCPVFFAHSVDDTIVNHEITKKYVEKVRDEGGTAELLLLPAGGHEPHTYGPPIDKTLGLSYFEGERLTITEAIEAVFSWIKKYDR